MTLFIIFALFVLFVIPVLPLRVSPVAQKARFPALGRLEYDTN